MPIDKYENIEQSSLQNLIPIMAGEVLTNTSLVSLGATAFIALFSYILSRFLGRKTSCVDRWILFWLIFDAIIHFTLVSKWLDMNHYDNLTITMNDE